MCTGFRRPKVFRDITYFVNTIVDNKLSIDNFCTQTSLLCLEQLYIFSSRWIFQPVSHSNWSQEAFGGVCLAQFPNTMNCKDMDIFYIDINVIFYYIIHYIHAIFIIVFR